MDSETIRVLVAVSAITLLEVIALILGYNGTVLSLSVGALAGLGGYELAKKTQEKV